MQKTIDHCIGSPECGASLYRQGLVRVHERLADGQTDAGRSLEVNTDESSWKIIVKFGVIKIPILHGQFNLE